MAEVPASEADLARALLRESPTASLATLNADGSPFASHVTIAPAPDLSPLTLLSRLAVHTHNLTRDPRASLLMVRDAAPDSMAASRLTLTGRLVRDDDPDLKRVFLERRADAARYAGFADFALYRFEIASGHLVAGFGRIVGLTPNDLLERNDR